jgi:hypothetical protein
MKLIQGEGRGTSSRSDIMLGLALVSIFTGVVWFCLGVLIGFWLA